ncbi:MAG: hypothetical protein ACLSAP_04610 [Oscillospiraceae bacterium]
MKIHWNRKYTTIAVYAFLVIAASILFAVFVGNFGMFLSGVSFFLSLSSPFLYGFAIAFLVNPVMKFCERCFQNPGDKYAGCGARWRCWFPFCSLPRCYLHSCRL